MFERFADDSRRVVVYAQEESRLLGHDKIGTEHLLLALLHGDDETCRALNGHGVTLAAARDRVAQEQGRGSGPDAGHIPFTPRAKRVLEQSLRQTQRLGQDHIAKPHLLRGLIEVRDSSGVQILVDFGVDLDALSAEADALASASEPGATTEGSAT